MKKFIASVMFALAVSMMLPTAMAAGSKVDLEDAKADIHDTSSLQRGAKYYINYCMGCHSLNYSRYSRIATDLELSEDQQARACESVGSRAGALVNLHIFLKTPVSVSHG